MEIKKGRGKKKKEEENGKGEEERRGSGREGRKEEGEWTGEFWTVVWCLEIIAKILKSDSYRCF